MAERKKAIHTGHRGRVKEEFLTRGIEGWPDHRVLELLLYYAIPQRDTNGLAHELIDRFGSLDGVLDALPEELMKVPGVRSGPLSLRLPERDGLCAVPGRQGEGAGRSEDIGRQ